MWADRGYWANKPAFWDPDIAKEIEEEQRGSAASEARISYSDVQGGYAFADLSAIMHGGLLLPVVGRHAYGRLLCACKWNRWTAKAAAEHTEECYMLDGWSGPDWDGNDSQA